ncbi:hypothetical protein DZF91_23955 [Actinomadura logoneensis]|uniref:Uncharacterized protein n=1 Tax=Actinomadura logoneensis TaxID=2293572 RepID=A0A372JGK2_9ACTN|nr:hypothetical protein [Actinomadura logoneensis]RFU39145.1 hypothetical protein DZF91_23955 [Actinomadura logoneensis]
MTWLAMAVALGSAGLAVLAWCSFRVWLGVRRLARELERTRRRLGPKHSVLRAEVRDLRDSRAPAEAAEGVRSS